MKVQDSSQISNGSFNMSEMPTLNSSRGRQRRNSLSKQNGVGSSSEENSPITQRRGIGLSPARNYSGKLPAGKSTEVASRNADNDTPRKRADSFVLDVNSIMSELNESGSSHTDEEGESSTKNSIVSSRTTNGVKAPGTTRLDPPPPPKTRKLQTETVTKTSLLRKTRDTAPSSQANESISSSLSSSKTARSEKEVSPSRFDEANDISKGKPPPGPSRGRKEGISTNALFKTDEAGNNDRTITKSDSDLLSYQNLRNRKDVKTKGETDVGLNDTSRGSGDSDVSSSRSSYVAGEVSKDRDGKMNGSSEDGDRVRQRANALSGAKRHDSASNRMDNKPKGTARKGSDNFDEDSMLDLNHRAKTGSSSKDVKRSSSFSLRRQMSGDKALGIFYHNRRSQMTDHEGAEEGERGGLERSGSMSNPQSPVTARAASRGLRDAAEAAANMPMSPLLSSSCSSDFLGDGMRSVRKTEQAERSESAVSLSSIASGSVPLSPRITVEKEDNTEVSACWFRFSSPGLDSAF